MNINKLMVLVLMLTLAVTSAFAYSFTGLGTLETPYEIANITDLYGLSVDSSVWNKHFIQTDDIDASTTANSSTGFKPIGSINPNLFTGSYDGQGFTISNLYINRPTEDKVGLFRWVHGATISNVGLIDVNITGKGFTGSVAGDFRVGTMTNCYATGSVKSEFDTIGGLVGSSAHNASITNCYSTCSVTGRSNIGGLTGQAIYSVIITNSYATGSVTGTGSLVGGLVGKLGHASSTDDTSNVENCYATGSVSGTDSVGGLVGSLIVNTTINDSYATGLVTGLVARTGNIGGLVGSNTGIVTNSFWDIETTQQVYSAGGEGKSTSEMRNLSTYSVPSWDVTDETDGGEYIWTITDGINNGYPYLTWAVDNMEVSETLPVTLSSFNAFQTSNNLAQIFWETASESSVLGYNIYRAESENQDETLRVTATMIEATNSATGATYYYVDAEVDYDITYYYWLQSNDFDGTFQMFGPVSVRISTQEDNDIEEMLLGTQMFANYPNPFNPSTTISFSVAEAQVVTIDVYNVKGQLVKRLFNSNVADINVKHSLVWNGQDSDGQSVASGIYFTIMKAGNKRFSNKTILMK